MKKTHPPPNDPLEIEIEIFRVLTHYIEVAQRRQSLATERR